MLKKILKIVGGVVAVLILIPIVLFGLMQIGVDISPVFNTIGSLQDKAKRPSPSAHAEATINGVAARIDYSQPAKKGRKIFGQVVPYNEVWRTGANEATTFTASGDMLIAGKLLKAGKYQLFTIPRPDKWTVIFNSKSGQWGAFFYDEKSDVLRVDVPSGASEQEVEQFTIQWEPNPENGFTMKWDKTTVFVPVGTP